MLPSAADGAGVGEAEAELAGPWPLLAPAAHLVPPGESVVLAIRPSLWYVLLVRAEWLLAIVLITIGALAVGVHGWLGVDAVLLAAGGALAASALLIFLFLDWMTRLYLLTDRRVVRVRGILRQSTVDLPLESVQNTVLQRSLRERTFGLGTVWFASAATTIGEFPWDYVAEPDRVMRAVRDTVERHRRLSGLE